jgi:hypothetical protein
MAAERVDRQLLTVLTTEHFVLQTARGGTIGEANGRAAVYLGALSTALIALGFVADNPPTFRVFAARHSGPVDAHRNRGRTLWLPVPAVESSAEW